MDDLGKSIMPKQPVFLQIDDKTSVLHEIVTENPVVKIQFQAAVPGITPKIIQKIRTYRMGNDLGGKSDLPFRRTPLLQQFQNPVKETFISEQPADFAVVI